jgi:hypothetical protein
MAGNKNPFLFDPDILWNSQFPTVKTNFGIFNDAMPDTLGSALMKKRKLNCPRKKKELLKI